MNDIETHNKRLTLSSITPGNVKTLSAVNRKKGIIEGCAVCTAGPAMGKPYTFSNSFIESLYTLASADGSAIKVENGHNVYENYMDAIIDIAYIDNISIDKTESSWVLRGDTNFYLPDSETAQIIMAKAEKQPKKFGLSIVFNTEDEYWKNGGRIDSATALHGADFVGTPAANPSGLLSRLNGIPNLLKHLFSEQPKAIVEQQKAVTEEPKILSSVTEGETNNQKSNNTMKIATPMARKFLSRAREIAYSLSGESKTKAVKIVGHFDNNPLPAVSANVADVDMPEDIGNGLTDLIMESGKATTNVVTEVPKSEPTELEKVKKELEETKLKLSSRSGHTGEGVATTHSGPGSASSADNMLSGEELWSKWKDLNESGKAKQANALYESNKEKMEEIPTYTARKTVAA